MRRKLSRLFFPSFESQFHVCREEKSDTKALTHVLQRTRSTIQLLCKGSCFTINYCLHHCFHMRTFQTPKKQNKKKSIFQGIFIKFCFFFVNFFFSVYSERKDRPHKKNERKKASQIMNISLCRGYFFQTKKNVSSDVFMQISFLASTGNMFPEKSSGAMFRERIVFERDGKMGRKGKK